MDPRVGMRRGASRLARPKITRSANHRHLSQAVRTTAATRSGSGSAAAAPSSSSARRRQQRQRPRRWRRRSGACGPLLTWSRSCWTRCTPQVRRLRLLCWLCVGGRAGRLDCPAASKGLCAALLLWDACWAHQPMTSRLPALMHCPPALRTHPWTASRPPLCLFRRL